MSTLSRISAGVLVAAIAAAHSAGAQNMRADSLRIRRDIETLASNRWEGRRTCTPGLDSAAALVAGRFRSLGLAPGATNFYHRYSVRAIDAAKWGMPPSCESQNVVGILRGTDASLANEFVIVGAHYDHLGLSANNALDPGSSDSIRNGADDNASGTAGVLELARIFKANPARRSIVFVTFSGEEQGILGSTKFAEDALPQGTPRAMVNFDMIGRLKGDKLLVYGTGTASEMPSIINANNTGTPFALSLIPDGYGPSDHSAFAGKMPVLHFFTDVHEDYHKASDESPKINAAGEARVLDFAARVIRDIADRDQLTYVAPERPRPTATSGAPRPYFGSVPDMAASDTPGLRVSGVSAGSPADKAGLKAGDIVVEFGGKPVKDLNDYSAALSAHKPGDTVKVVVLRGTERITLTVTLTVRGQ